MVDRAYADIQFPFDEIKVPPMQMCSEWNLTQLLGYLRTWSAYKRYMKQRGSDPLEMITDELNSAWGNHDVPRRIEWPLSLRVWKSC